MSSAPVPSGVRSVPVGHAFIVGRVQSKPRKYDRNDGSKAVATVVVCAAPDAFSSPSRLEIRSDKPIGDVGSDFEGVVRIGGIIESFQYTDKVSGEVMRGQRPQAWFTLVD